jgi:hypothetical protein
MIEKRYVKALADLNFPERAIAELGSCLAVAPYRAESWQMMNEIAAATGRLTTPPSPFPWRKPKWMFICTNARRLRRRCFALRSPPRLQRAAECR